MDIIPVEVVHAAAAVARTMAVAATTIRTITAAMTTGTTRETIGTVAAAPVVAVTPAVAAEGTIRGTHPVTNRIRATRGTMAATITISGTLHRNMRITAIAAPRRTGNVHGTITTRREEARGGIMVVAARLEDAAVDHRRIGTTREAVPVPGRTRSVAATIITRRRRAVARAMATRAGASSSRIIGAVAAPAEATEVEVIPAVLTGRATTIHRAWAHPGRWRCGPAVAVAEVAAQ